MGGGVTKDVVYAVPVSEPKKGETAIYRSSKMKDKLITQPKSGINTAKDIFLTNFKRFPERPYLGYRPITAITVDPKSNKKVPTLKQEYEFFTFSEVEKKIRLLGSGIKNLGLSVCKEQYKSFKIDFVGVHSKNSVEWILLDIANLCYGMTTMPLYDTLGEPAVDFMLNETELTTLFIGSDQVVAHSKRIKEGRAKFLKNLVIMDEEFLTADENKILQELETSKLIKWMKFSDVIEAGKNNISDYPEINPESIAFFSYTSGATGTPKGAMVSHKNIVAMVAGVEYLFPFVNENTIAISYLPLAHLFEKIVFYQISFLGGKYGMFGGDVMKLKEDLAILKPTVFFSVPRLFNRFHDLIKSKFSEQTGCTGTMAKKAINTKLAAVDSGKYTHFVYDKLVFNKVKQFLGGKVEFMATGSAPLATQVKKYLKCAFSVPFLEAYGQTEGMGLEFVTDMNEKRFDIVGGPNPVNEFKLIDVPEMNYFSTDKDEEGKLQPRGEICVRGANVLPGYYKNDEKTNEAIDSEGWLHSGDIGMIVPGINGLKIIDRRKNIFKLSQGEYIAPERLEQFYKTTRGLSDVFVYGDSLKSSLVAVANLEPKEALKIAAEKNIQASSVEELANNKQFNKLIIDALRGTADESGLKGFERIARLHIDSKPFGDQDLLTSTFKLKRTEASKHYEKVIKKLYEGLE